MTPLREAGVLTGTADKDYDLIWFTEVCLSNALRLESCIEHARRNGDEELATFFARAQVASVNRAEEGKSLLTARIAGVG